MKVRGWFLLIIFLSLFISCKNNVNENMDPLDSFLDMKNAQTEKDLEIYYSKSTLSAVKKLKKKYPETEVLTGLDRKLFSGNLVYKITSEKCSGKKCKIEFIVTNHNSINFIGISIKLNLVFEDSRWKIDRSRELSKQL